MTTEQGPYLGCPFCNAERFTTLRAARLAHTCATCGRRAFFRTDRVKGGTTFTAVVADGGPTPVAWLAGGLR